MSRKLIRGIYRNVQIWKDETAGGTSYWKKLFTIQGTGENSSQSIEKDEYDRLLQQSAAQDQEFEETGNCSTFY